MSAVLHQATCVAITREGRPRALLIEGPPGSGKSSLALALIDRGAALVGDDGVLLELREGRLWALPPPHITGMIEVRNVGIVTMEAIPAPVALLVRLDPDAPRLPEGAETVPLAGARIPLVRLHPAAPPLPLRAETALILHGTN